jgi:hypothetical protein
MISMPEDAFLAIEQIANQLAQGIAALAQSVRQQKSAGAGEAPAGEMPPAGPAGGASGGSPADEEFLKGIAEAGSQR